MSATKRNDIPVIQHVYDPLSQKHDGTITPCAPVLVTGSDFLCRAKEQIEICLCPVGEPGHLIPVTEVYIHTDKQILVALPDLGKGEYRLVFRWMNGAGEDEVYFFPDIWCVRNVTLTEIYIERYRTQHDLLTGIESACIL